MKTAAALLLVLSMLGGMVGLVALMPLQAGFLAEGSPAPTDEGEVRAAAARLMLAGAALWFAAVLMNLQPAPGIRLRFYAGAAAAYTAYRAWQALVLIAAWFSHVQGPSAVYYHLAVAAPCAVLLLLGALHAFI